MNKVTIDEICMELRGECNGCKRDMLADRIEAYGIEQPSGEPVAWGDLSQIMNGFLTTDNEIADEYSRDCYQLTPLYTAPPSIDALIAEIDALINPELHSLIQLKSVLAIIDKYRGQK